MSEFWDDIPVDDDPEARGSGNGRDSGRKKKSRAKSSEPIKYLNGQLSAPVEIVPPEFADDELALRFSNIYQHTLRYVAAWNRWMAWDGSVWRHDDTLRVWDLARGICRQASADAGQPKLQAAIASGRTVAAVEKLARSDRRHAATAQQWDADPWFLNTPRGYVDLTTGELLPARPEQHFTKCTAVTPYGECPKWLKFLGEVTNGDVELQEYLKRVAGYALTGSVREQALFFAYGTGGNGKGTFLNTIQAIMGDYALVASAETFTASVGSRHLTELARLQGARLVVAQETEEGKGLAEARVKAITGGDPITANYMRQDPFTYLPQFKLFISGNHKPPLRNIDEAIRRRFNMVPFNVKIRNPVPDLAEQLKSEWQGILQWMVEGCVEWLENRLNPPISVTSATAEYFDAEDVLSMWLEQKCLLGAHRYARSGDLFRSWEKWAKGAGEAPGTQKRFTQNLISRGFQVKKSDGYPTFSGIEVVRPKDFTDTDREDQG